MMTHLMRTMMAKKPLKLGKEVLSILNDAKQ